MSDEMRKTMDSLAGLEQPLLGSGFGNQQTGMVLNADAAPDQIKLALTRLARHIEPGEWDAAVVDTKGLRADTLLVAPKSVAPKSVAPKV